MKLTYIETADFCRGLAVLMHGGIGALEGVYLLAEDETRPIAKALTEMGSCLEMGNQLSFAMEQTGIFPEQAVAMVRVGEETGRLEETLSSMAEYYDQSHRTARQVKNALAYPCIILGLMLVVIGVLLIKVMPVFDAVYVSMGSRLTGVAAWLLHLGEFLKAALPVLLVLAAVIGIMALLFAKCARFRGRVLSWYKSRFGDKGVSAKFNNARFARALSMGICSGLPMEDAIELSKGLLEDMPGAVARCEKCAQLLNEGKDLSAAMGEAKLLTPAQTRVLTAGMRSGNADEVLDEMADRMHEEAAEALENLVSKVEPSIVLAVSLLVGLVLLSVMLPLLSIMSAIG